MSVKLIVALENFRDAALKLTEEWSDSPVNDLSGEYPFEEDFQSLSMSISSWVNESIEGLKEDAVTHYLFGESTCRFYDEGGIDLLLKRNSSSDFVTFKFEEGKTLSTEFLAAYDGYGAYRIIESYEYDRLQL